MILLCSCFGLTWALIHIQGYSLIDSKSVQPAPLDCFRCTLALCSRYKCSIGFSICMEGLQRSTRGAATSSTTPLCRRCPPKPITVNMSTPSHPLVWQLQDQQGPWQHHLQQQQGQQQQKKLQLFSLSWHTVGRHPAVQRHLNKPLRDQWQAQHMCS